MNFDRGDEVATAIDLGGFWQGKIPAGTPGVIDEVDDPDSSPVFTVTSLSSRTTCSPHQTVTGLTITELSKQ